jgi:hypothetical protein
MLGFWNSHIDNRKADPVSTFNLISEPEIARSLEEEMLLATDNR